MQRDDEGTAERQGTDVLRPRARLIRAIGDELISSETVALLELVKNSYDADATAVLVRFVPPLAENLGRVQVIDNGHGMTLETIRGAWMEPATSFKRASPKSEQLGRRVLGEKGLGRFSAARIAQHFYATTRRRKAPTETRVLFDWNEFDHPERYLDQVEVLWEVTHPKEIYAGSPVEDLLRRADLIGPEDAHEQGTILSLELLRKSWSPEDVRHLRRALSRLVSPFPGEQPAEFGIYLQMPPGDLEEFDGRVSPPAVFGHPDYAVTGTVFSDGRCDITVARKSGASVSVQKPLRLKGERSPLCGEFQLNLRMWNREQKTLGKLATDLGSTLKDLRRDLDAVSGVYLYRDGFRILPYGEPGTDWLGLDLRRVQNPQMRFSNNQLSCHVLISKDRNPLLLDQSNREGLFENQASRDLRELLVNVIAELEAIRDQDRPVAEAPDPQMGLFDGFNITDVRDAVASRHPADRELLKVVDDSQRRIDRRVEAVKGVLSRYQRLSTLGSLVDMVLHEGRQPVFRIRHDADSVRTRLQRATPETLPLIMDQLVAKLDAIDKSADLLTAVFKRLDPFSGRQKGRPRDVILEDVIRDAVQLVAAEVRDVGAQVSVSPTQTSVRVDPADIQTVLRNLLDNSLYWLRDVPKDQRSIRIDVRRTADDEVEVEVSDSGPGVPEEARDRIWTAYFSRKPEGTGLGLAIAGEIIKDVYGGDLELLEEGPLCGANFRMTLRRRV